MSTTDDPQTPIFSPSQLDELVTGLEAELPGDQHGTKLGLAVGAAISVLKAIASGIVVGPQCRLDLPYARMYEIRDTQGVFLVCDHNPQHRTKIA
jgi:hypothetical protein